IFRIFLPRYIPGADDVEVPQLPETTAPAIAISAADEIRGAAADLTGRGTILLVEDEEGLRALNARGLQSRGYTVIEAGNGLEPLAELERQGGHVDVVVSDVVMPEMDGPALMKELKKRKPDIKIIFVSGYAEDAFDKNLPDRKQFNFLAKPFTLKQLVRVVKETMAGGVPPRFVTCAPRPPPEPCPQHTEHQRPVHHAHFPAKMTARTKRNAWRPRATAGSPTRSCCFSSSSWWAAGSGSPMPCSSSAGSTTAWRRAGATARRRSRRRRDRRSPSAMQPEPSAPVHIFLKHRMMLRTFYGRRLRGGCHAGQIEETTDGRGRGARGQARRALEGKPQGRLTRDGGNDERAATARVRQHQATGAAAQAQRMSAQSGGDGREGASVIVPSPRDAPCVASPRTWRICIRSA